MQLFLRPAAVLAGGLVALMLTAGGVDARIVQHAMGETEVPDRPERIVVLTNEGTEAVLALGLAPVGAVRSWTGDPWYRHLADRMQGVTVVGTEHAPNLEVIAALRPDLILGNRARQEAIYPQLSAIAPTVFSDGLRGAWRENLRLYAEALGRAPEGEALLADFARRTETIAERLGDRIEEEISLVRFLPSATRIYHRDSFAGTILEQIGFSRPPAQDATDFAAIVTKERIPEMEGDRLFYFVYETGEGDALDVESDWTSDPLWMSLDVVQSGKVHRVSDAIWNSSGGVISANAMLDDIEEVYGLDREASSSR